MLPVHKSNRALTARAHAHPAPQASSQAQTLQSDDKEYAPSSVDEDSSGEESSEYDYAESDGDGSSPHKARVKRAPKKTQSTEDNEDEDCGSRYDLYVRKTCPGGDRPHLIIGTPRDLHNWERLCEASANLGVPTLCLCCHAVFFACRDQASECN